MGEAAPEEFTGVLGFWPLPIFSSPPFVPFISWPASSGVDPPFTLICESFEVFSTPFSSGVEVAPVVFVFEAIDFVLLDCCLSLAEGILFFVRSVGLGPDGTSGRRIKSEPRGFLAGEVELAAVAREEAPAVLDAVVLLDAVVGVVLTGAVRGVGAFLVAAAPFDDVVAVFVEARDVAVVEVNVDLDVVDAVDRVVFGTVVLGETGVLLLDPLAGDAVRVMVLLADTLDVAVFLGSSTLGLATGGLEAIVLDVRDDGFAPGVVEEAPAVFGFVAGVLAERGCLDGVVVAVLGVGVLARGFAATLDLAVAVELTGVLLDGVVPDAGLLLANVDPGVGCFEADVDAALDTGVELGLVAVGLVFGLGDDTVVPDVLDEVVVLETAGLALRFGDGDAAVFPSTDFFASTFFVSFSSDGFATAANSVTCSVSGTLTSISNGLSLISL